MMVAHRLRDLYERSPQWLRRTVGPLARQMPARWRFGPVYSRTCALASESETWPPDRLAAYQAAQLRRVIRHAYENTRYYRALFDRLGLGPEAIRGPEDLHRLPLLTREDVRRHQDALLSAAIHPGARKFVTTAGTSGAPLGFHVEKDSSIIEWAFMAHQWARVGYREGDLRVVLRGRVLPAGPRKRPWSYDPLLGELTLSSFHMDDANLHRYVDVIHAHRPRFLHAYPSTATILARFLHERGIDLPPLRAALIGSENLLDAQRAFLEEVLRCRVYSWYGHSEKCLLAGECEHNRQYHIFPQYGVAELVDESGAPIHEPGVPGRLVGTSLISVAMPLLRYLTDDWAQWAVDEPCLCGRPYRRIDNVTGRWHQEVLVGRSGALFPMAALNLHSSIYTRIRQFQFHQSKPGEAVLRIVPAVHGALDGEREILAEFAQRIGHDIDLRMERVAAIAHTARGKYRFVDQELPVTPGLGTLSQPE